MIIRNGLECGSNNGRCKFKRRFSIEVSHCKIIEDFPRLLKGVGKSRIGEEEGTCTIHKFLPFIQQL